MNFFRHPITMLIAGALAGFLSGLRMPTVFGIRGALFGFCLSLTALWIRKKEWGWNKLIPGIILGLILFVVPNVSSFSHGIRAFINCAIFIPVYALCYLQPKFHRVILGLLPAGALCTAIRVNPLHHDEISKRFEMYNMHLVQGTLLFLALWLIFMWLTDPRFIRTPKAAAEAEQKTMSS